MHIAFECEYERLHLNSDWVIQVEGRRDEILQVPTREGRSLLLSPMALSTVIEETRGMQRFQVIQTRPTTLRIRLDARPGANEAEVWTELINRLRAYLAAHGPADITLERASERPAPHPVSGKFRQVWADLQAGLPGPQQQVSVPSLTRGHSGGPSEEEPYPEEGD